MTATYHSQLHALLGLCKTFYAHLLPILYASPLLLTLESVTAFAARAPLVPLHLPTPAGALLQRLSLHSSPPATLIKSWAKHLTTILSHAPYLTALTLGPYTQHLPLDLLLPLTRAPSRIRSLNKLSLYGTRETNAEAVSLIARCPFVDTISFAALNLLDGTASAVYTMEKMLDASSADVSDDEDEPIWTLAAANSVWARFREALILRERCGVAGQRGIRSLFFWQLSVITTAVLWEILELTQHLEWCVPCFLALACLPRRELGGADGGGVLLFQPGDPVSTSMRTHFSPLPRSPRRCTTRSRARRSTSRASSSASPSSSCASLPSRHCSPTGFPSLATLTICSLFVHPFTTRKSNPNSALQACPTLTHLELRADHLTPDFFATLLQPHSLDYLGLHVLPPHGPRLASVDGRPSICTTIFLFFNDGIEELAQAIERLGPCGWPRGGMERDKGDDSGWYEVLSRCASGRRDL